VRTCVLTVSSENDLEIIAEYSKHNLTIELTEGSVLLY
jgi:hypothetical protein